MEEGKNTFLHTAGNIRRIITTLVNAALAVTCIVLVIYNFVLSSVAPEDQAGKVTNIFLQILFTMPTIILNFVLSIGGFICSCISIAYKIKWMKITNAVLAVILLAAFICTVVAFFMLKATLSAGAAV